MSGVVGNEMKKHSMRWVEDKRADISNHDLINSQVSL